VVSVSSRSNASNYGRLTAEHGDPAATTQAFSIDKLMGALVEITHPEPAAPADPALADRPAAPSLRRRNARIAASGVVVMALAAAALSGLVPGVPLRSGPLDGGGGGISAPVPATGMVLGLNLTNSSGADIVLDSIEVAKNPNRVPLLRDPYLWADPRASGAEVISAAPLPMPAEWTIPPRQAVRGHVIRSGKHQQPLKINETESENVKYTGDSPLILVEFAQPDRASEIGGLTVRYHIGWQAFSKRFDTTLLMCPPSDPAPCA